MKHFIAAAALVGAVLACWLPAGAVASHSGTVLCKSLPGKPWKDYTGKTGSKYNVYVTGVTCAFVKPWVMKLSGPHPGQQFLKGGPAGWQCFSQGGGVPLGFSCTQGSPPKGKVFTGNPSNGANSG
jgi:hypothetical protein